MTTRQREAVARLFRALGEPSRLAILQALQDGPRTVSEVVNATGAKQANVSKQLGILFDAGLLDRQREGTTVRYFICDQVVIDLCAIVCRKVSEDAHREAQAWSSHTRPDTVKTAASAV